MAGGLPDERVRPALSLQRWDRVAFVHWRYRPDELRPLLPPGVRLQVVDGSAWVGLVPLVLHLRVPGLPAPGWATFAEVNVRTYVTDGEHDGLVFLRVHCARRLVVAALRAGLGLPYAYVPGRAGTRAGVTTWAMTGTRVAVEAGTPAAPDPLLTALTARFSAFTRHVGATWRVPVEHPPWPLHEARVLRLRTDALRRAGLPDPRDERPLAHWSPGVDVRVGAPRPAAPGRVAL
ncbi:YqjF family protein [Puerhibacterium sp. TATVAM-FAB25]|uniref:YqjF family protein n=1 Tax=Puerhibacterium sp. TATVAM-FAB25 TaxID=3093699 RepID=UPI00397967C4